MNKLVAALVTLAVAGGAAAQVTKSGSGYTLRMKFVQGQKSSYEIRSTMTQGTRKALIIVPLSMTVLSVQVGVGTVEQKVGPMTVNGKEMGVVRRETLKQDPRGKVIGPNNSNLGTVSFPAGPIRQGGAWTSKTNIVAGTAGQMAVDATYKLIGLESVGGRQAAKIAVSMKGTGGATVTGTGTMWVAVTDGSLVKSTMKSTVTIGRRSAPMVVDIIRK